jgi:hypothetical protein
VPRFTLRAFPPRLRAVAFHVTPPEASLTENLMLSLRPTRYLRAFGLVMTFFGATLSFCSPGSRIVVDWRKMLCERSG